MSSIPPPVTGDGHRALGTRPALVPVKQEFEGLRPPRHSWLGLQGPHPCLEHSEPVTGRPCTQSLSRRGWRRGSERRQGPVFLPRLPGGAAQDSFWERGPSEGARTQGATSGTVLCSSGPPLTPVRQWGLGPEGRGPQSGVPSPGRSLASSTAGRWVTGTHSEGGHWAGVTDGHRPEC